MAESFGTKSCFVEATMTELERELSVAFELSQVSFAAAYVPHATTTFVKPVVTFDFEHEYSTRSPGAKVLLLCGAMAAMSAAVFAQSAARASVVLTFVRVTSPSFSTWIVQVAVPPLEICWLWLHGDADDPEHFRTLMCGFWTTLVSPVSPHAV